MENRKANWIGFSIILLLIIVIITARILLSLSRTFFLICGADIAAIIAVIAILIIHARFNNRRIKLEIQHDSEGRELRIEYSFLRKVACVPTKFRHRELEEATDGFRSLIGRGGSGCVYKGVLNNGTAVAVKRIDGEERGEKVFKSEVAAIASIQHVNLVRLLGYSISSTGPRFLVYEYIHNGSLDNWIFPKLIRGNHASSGRSGCLSWDQRCKVAFDVAKALSYLHHDCRSCILHLDVKPENILIDDSYHALVADFGLSKLKNREDSRIVTNIRGTSGYLAPEWLLENGVSEKCDIYSYGMVLLEIIGGRRNISVLEQKGDHPKKKFQFFPKIVVEKMKEGKLMEIVDDRLLGNGGIGIRERDVKKMVKVALWCIQEDPKIRPSMTRVVEMLEGRLTVEDPPETQMLVVDLLSGMGDDENEDGRHARHKPRFAQLDQESTSNVGCSFGFSILSGR